MFSSAFKSFTSNITSNYEISKQPSATVGVWNIFQAKKKSTNSQASIFVFERKALDVSASSANFGAKASSTSVRKAQDEVVERLKREALNLARLRHPSILQLVEPVEDTRAGGLMFATEPVIAPLSAALAQKDGGSSRNRWNDTSSTCTTDVEIDELEIQKGLLQVAKGLEFLHDSAKLVHGNLTPDAIFINAKSDWKLSGLGFAGPPDNAEGHQTLPQISLSEALYNDPRVPASVQLNIDYASPDFVLDSNINFSADIYSLGLVLVACYREPHHSPFETHGNQSTYKKILSTTSTNPGPANNYGCSNKLPRELESTLPRVLARRPAARMNATEFQQSEYFDNILVNTMRFLDGLPAKSAAEKQSFLRGLPRVMAQFPKSVLEKKILGVLLDELKDRDLLASILQNVFQILNMVPNREIALSTKVLPATKDIFLAQAKSQERDTSKDAGLVVYLEHAQLMANNSTALQFKEDVLPVISTAMQSTTHSLVDAALGTLPVILPVLDFSTVKHDLFPVIAVVFSKTSSLGIKVRGLEAIAVLCGATDASAMSMNDDLSGMSSSRETAKSNVSSLDKFTMQEKVLPLLKGIKTKEPAVMMTALKVFQQIARVGDSEFLATEVMPLLWSFALGPLLDLSQFKAYMEIIQALTQRIQKEQIKKLQELATVNRSVSESRERSMAGSGRLSSNSATGALPEQDFERLVLSGRNTSSNADPFSGALSDGQKLVPNAPSYSWQSTSGSTTPAHASTSLAPAQPQSRSITPDVSMSSFPTLQPGSGLGSGSVSSPWSQSPQQNTSISTSSWSQPLQPVSHGDSSWNANNGRTPATSMQSTNQWATTTSTQSSVNNSRLQASNFLPSQSAAASTSHASGSSSNFVPMLAPPPQSPPPQSAGWSSLSAANQMQTRQNQHQQTITPPQPKSQGLDKYQSLI